MAPMSLVPAARSVSSRMRNFSPAVNVRRLGRFDNSGLAAAGAGTTVGLRPSSVPVPAAACTSATLLGMTTRQFSYALKSKLPGGLCLIIIGTEGALNSRPARPGPCRCGPAAGLLRRPTLVLVDVVPGDEFSWDQGHLLGRCLALKDGVAHLDRLLCHGIGVLRR